jgi:hypothetical protein
MDAHAGLGTAAPPRPEHRATVSGDEHGPALPAPQAAGPGQHTIAQLEALGAERFDLRLRGPGRHAISTRLHPAEVVHLGGPYGAGARRARPAGSARGSPVQFVSWKSGSH